jgi:hypothetical protein
MILTAETPQYSEKYLLLCHSAHHKSHMNWPGTETEPLRREAGDESREPCHGPHVLSSITASKVSVH